MTRINVPASKQYYVIVCNNVLNDAGLHLQQVLTPSCKIAIISDSHVWPLYGDKVQNSLELTGFQVVNYVFPAGETSKNATNYLEILNFLAQNQITRSDAIVALGGGVVGDIAGFSAATYLRGIAYVQIPTTLLAMVDSSIGGKTAIDLPVGKNLVGAFYQPDLVLCDPEVLTTLPHDIFTDGCAEVIKYGMLYDAALFDHLMNNGSAFDREKVIIRCIELKRDTVCADEFDTGLRQKLNLGHTIGHSIETLSNYMISHGQAVSTGMAIVTKAAAARNLCERAVLSDLLTVLDKFKLPTVTEYSDQQLFTCALSDKKRAGSSLNLIVPRAIGYCEIIPTPVDMLKSFIQDGL
ncbi:MAG: 3-dehydroquinate synthase [Oscillospiraceae bacterium]|nr:3-dehydroquinate synthase [Oscillospiraceae bacterium]